MAVAFYEIVCEGTFEAGDGFGHMNSYRAQLTLQASKNLTFPLVSETSHFYPALIESPTNACSGNHILFSECRRCVFHDSLFLAQFTHKDTPIVSRSCSSRRRISRSSAVPTR